MKGISFFPALAAVSSVLGRTLFPTAMILPAGLTGIGDGFHGGRGNFAPFGVDLVLFGIVFGYRCECIQTYMQGDFGKFYSLDFNSSIRRGVKCRPAVGRRRNQGHGRRRSGSVPDL